MSAEKQPPTMAERGRSGGKASGEARRKRKERRSLLDVWKSRGDPEQLFDGLAQSAAGNVALARILEKGGAFEPPEEAHKPSEMTAGIGLAELVALAYSSGNAAAYGLPASVDEFKALLGQAEDQGSSASGARARERAATDARASTPADDEDEGGLPPLPPGAPQIRRSPKQLLSTSRYPSEEGAPPPPRPLGPPPRYKDAGTEAIYKWRSRRGLPTGNVANVYLAVGDDGNSLPPSTIGAMRSAIAAQQGQEQRP